MFLAVFGKVSKYGAFLILREVCTTISRILWGDNMVEVSCKGCVCLECKQSEQNGDYMRCPYKSCRICTDEVHHVRATCDRCLPLPEKAKAGDFVL